MVEELGPRHESMMIAYAAEHEQQLLLVAGAFREPEPFKHRRFFGFIEGTRLRGLALYHELWKSFTLHAESAEIAMMLAEYAFDAKLDIETVLAFKKHASPVVEALAKRGKQPKEVSDEDVFVLTSDRFAPVHDSNVRPPQPEDLDAWIRLDRLVGGRDVDAPIRPFERERLFLRNAHTLFVDGVLVSKANLHTVTDRFAQVGGVATHPEHRGKGYAKKCVSALCAACFRDGIKTVLLFTDKTNVPAQKVYRGLGFEVIDEFMMAEY